MFAATTDGDSDVSRGGDSARCSGAGTRHVATIADKHDAGAPISRLHQESAGVGIGANGNIDVARRCERAIRNSESGAAIVAAIADPHAVDCFMGEKAERIGRSDGDVAAKSKIYLGGHACRRSASGTGTIRAPATAAIDDLDVAVAATVGDVDAAVQRAERNVAAAIAPRVDATIADLRVIVGAGGGNGYAAHGIGDRDVSAVVSLRIRAAIADLRMRASTVDTDVDLSLI